MVWHAGTGVKWAGWEFPFKTGRASSILEAMLLPSFRTISLAILLFLGLHAGSALGLVINLSNDPNDPELVRVPSETPAPVKKDPGPGKVWSAAELDDIIQRLGDERFEVREAAGAELEEAAPAMLDLLREAALKSKDSEVQSRIYSAMNIAFRERVLPKLPQTRKGLGFLGIGWALNEQPVGVRVNNVLSGYAADRAGVKINDLFLSINGNKFEDGLTREGAMEIFQAMAPGDHMSVLIQRTGESKPLDLVITVGEKPNEHVDMRRQLEQQEKLCEQFMDGELKIPRYVLNSKPGTGGPYMPLQSWPKELEGK